MFLTRKALNKITLLTAAYGILGVFCFIVAGIFAGLLIANKLLIILGIVSLILGIIFRTIGKYAEGKGKLINSGNKLIFHELRPAEFIRLYEEKRDCPDNVLSKPDFDVLQLLTTAYDALGDTDHELETLDQMLSVGCEKQKATAHLLKSAVLFSMGKVEEADLLYSEVQNGKMSLLAKTTADIIMRSDRAMALGDFTTAETYYKQMLTKTFPKSTPLSILYAHFHLAKIYSQTKRIEEAKIHCRYCVENGGETGIQSEAAAMLNTLNIIGN